MFATKQTTIVPEIHGAQDSGNINLGQVPNLELESGTTGAPGNIVQQDGGKFDLQFGRMSLAFTAGHILQVVTNVDNTEYGVQTGQTPYNYSELNTSITLKKANSKILINFNFGAVSYQDTGNLGYGKVMFKIGSGSYSDVTPIGLNQVVTGGSRHHMAVNYTSANYRVDAGATMTVIHTTSSAKDTVHTYAPYFFGEGVNADVFINRSFRDGSPYDFSSISSCTLMEIAT